MTFNDYKHLAIRTSKQMNGLENLVHMALGISSEYFEVLEANKLAKISSSIEEQVENTKKLSDELGDVLWYAACLCLMYDLDFSRGHDFRKTSIQYAIERITSIGKSSWVYNRPMDEPDKTGFTPRQQLQEAIYNIIMWVELDFPFKIDKIFKDNIEKLQKRYPEKYSDQDANERKDD